LSSATTDVPGTVVSQLELVHPDILRETLETGFEASYQLVELFRHR
jgi:hypothetical protein